MGVGNCPDVLDHAQSARIERKRPVGAVLPFHHRE